MSGPLINAKFSLNDLKKDLGGVANRLAQDAVTNLENKLENAVEGAFTGLLKKIGLSSTTAGILSARFGDALLHGLADDYFKTGNSEVTRLTPQEICDNVLARKGSETSFEAHSRAVDGASKAGNIPSLQFPEHLGDYYMIMKFYDYKRPAPQVQAEMTQVQAIVLPIPKDLKEEFNIKIADQSLGTAGGVTDAIQAAKSNGGKAFDINNAVIGLAYSALQSKQSDTASVAGQIAGAVANPFMGAIFQGMGLRTHSFDWIFAPRNEKESMTLQNIILNIKQNALPTYSTIGTGALSYPRICQVELHPWHNDVGHELIKFKPCLISNISVNHSPGGVPSFFAGTQLPTFSHISLQMMEMEIVTANDYGIEGGRDRLDAFVKKADDLAKALFPDAEKGLKETANELGGAIKQGLNDSSTIGGKK